MEIKKIGILVIILINLIGSAEPYRIHGTKERVAQTKSNLQFLTMAAESCGINLQEYQTILCYPDTR